MLKAIVRWSLHFRGVVIALACALLGYGVYSLSQARYDIFPNFAPPEVSIQTEAPGLAPGQVELLVTLPIERAIVGAPGVQTVRSGSIQGLSVVTVVFRSNRNIYLDRQVTGERLATVAGHLPAGVLPPIMTPLTSSASTVLEIGLTWPNHSLMDLSTVADWTLKPSLLAVPGVAKVAVFGDEPEQIQIQFEPEKLIQYGLSVRDVLNAASRATGIRGAGFMDTPNQRIVLATRGQWNSPARIARTVVFHRNGSNVTLGQVAQVTEAPAPAIGGATVRGVPGLVMDISSQYGANTLEVTRRLDGVLQALRPALARQGIILDANVFRPADFIRNALHNIRSSLLIGAGLVIVVLFLFLFNFRTAAISSVAIPLSLLAAVVVLDKLGQSVNTMTLGGLAIAIGEVVDDAVIDVENIYRRLRENNSLPHPRSVFSVIFDASIEVRSAVVYATFAVILVFFPVITLSGLAGRIFAPLGMAYIWAILASLVVALTVTPALCYLLLGGRDLPPQESPLLRSLKAGYRNLLMGVEKAPYGVLAGVAAVILAGAFILPRLKGSFLPHLAEGNITVHMTLVPGTSIRQSLRLGDRVTQALLRIPNVASVAQRAGRAELGDDTSGTHASEFEVNFKPHLSGGQMRATRADIHRVLRGFAGAVFSSNSFFTERINETLSGYASGVAVNIFGNRLGQLDSAAGKVARVLARTPGARDVEIQSPPGAPQVVIRLRQQELNRWGFDPVHVLKVVETAFGGDLVGQVYHGNRVLDVSVILAPQDRQSENEIGNLPLRGPDGNYVPLSQIADIEEGSGRSIIRHEGARRVDTVTCNVEGRDLASFIHGARRSIDRLSLPAGTYVEFGGTAAEQARSRQELLIHSLLAGLGIVLLLSVVMRNYRNLLLVLLNLPLALVGGVLAAWVTGGHLSLGSLIGFVTLFGITLRNSIMMISHYEHLVSEEGLDWGLEAALKGAGERLAPILMTALVTGLGLLPLALGSGSAGREIEGPMAIVILGGLMTSTVLNLLVLPTLALRFGRFQKSVEAVE
ncbi:MAG TPA: efflux RND transporter permease subunit [Terriglobia bacterium]|nr:efflux RND transporter permease subunit [Terriglobia bacterium]